MTEESITNTDLLAYTCEIASAYASENEFPASDLPEVIRSIHATLKDIAEGGTGPEARPEPAVSIRASVKPDHLVCLEDGKKLKMLKRYLKTKYNMTPAEYRERWGLPADYPMVAPNYTAQRSALAKSIGLGQKRKGTKKKK
jgi:predicted transcriptional regulator